MFLGVPVFLRCPSVLLVDLQCLWEFLGVPGCPTLFLGFHRCATVFLVVSSFFYVAPTVFNGVSRGPTVILGLIGVTPYGVLRDSSLFFGVFLCSGFFRVRCYSWFLCVPCYYTVLFVVPHCSTLFFVISRVSSLFYGVFHGSSLSYGVPRGFSRSYGVPRFNRGSSLFFGVPLRYSFSYGVLLQCSPLLYGVPLGSSLFFFFRRSFGFLVFNSVLRVSFLPCGVLRDSSLFFGVFLCSGFFRVRGS